MNTLQADYYKGILLTLKQKRTHGKDNIAKPILLLAILKLIEEGHIIGNMIKFDEQLIITYTRIFKNYSEKVTPIEYPYYYMRNDCFYSIKGKAEKKTPSVNYIKQNIEYAYLDDDLWDIIQDKSTRDWLKHEIIEYYLK